VDPEDVDVQVRAMRADEVGGEVKTAPEPGTLVKLSGIPYEGLTGTVVEQGKPWEWPVWVVVFGHEDETPKGFALHEVEPLEVDSA
jgi:hypothetical protein